MNKAQAGYITQLAQDALSKLRSPKIVKARNRLKEIQAGADYNAEHGLSFTVDQIKEWSTQGKV